MKQGRFPNLFLAGAPKCGTTSLADWLAQHPDVFTPLVKEPVFFASDLTSANPPMSGQAYLDLYRRRANERYAVDASTHYFFSRVAARRISGECESPRILMLLRNPVEAAYSLYHQLRFTGSEDLEVFEASLAAEEGRARSLRPLARGYPETRLYTQVYDFKSNISRYLENFPRESLHILLLDDLRHDPRIAFESVLKWLSLDASVAATVRYDVSNPAKTFRSRFLNDLAHYPPRWAGYLTKPFLTRSARLRLRGVIKKANVISRANPPIDPNTRRQLQERFKSQVDWLEGFLQRDLSHWLREQGGSV